MPARASLLAIASFSNPARRSWQTAFDQRFSAAHRRALTGESYLSEKSVRRCSRQHYAGGSAHDGSPRRCVDNGAGVAVAPATGAATEIGRVRHLLENAGSSEAADGARR
ncbi:MAG: hypothetical protein R3C30_09150 [Hyphomonadaceae bacterium]